MVKQKQPEITEYTIKAIEDQIVYYQSKVDGLKTILNIIKDTPPLPEINFFPLNPPQLTKDLIRKYMQATNKAVQTVEVVNTLYPDSDEEVKSKAIKTLSVIFNTLEKDGQIKVEKQEGVKGNFYTWITK